MLQRDAMGPETSEVWVRGSGDDSHPPSPNNFKFCASFLLAVEDVGWAANGSLL